MRLADLTLVSIFLAVIAVPGVGLLLGWDPQTISESERRELAPLPVWSEKSTVGSFLSESQRFFEDHFTFRSRMIKLHAAVVWYGLRTSSSPDVIGGADDWMFYAADGGLEDYVQQRPFSESDLEAWRQTLEEMRDWCERRGIKFLYVLAPDKQMIYPQKMPPALRRMRNDYRADQLLAHLRSKTTLSILDLRPALEAARLRELVYHRHDTHWNDRGAFAAEIAIADELAKWFPAIRPLTRSEFVESAGTPSGDRTPMLGLDDDVKTTMPGLTPVRGWSWKTVEPHVADPYGEDGRTATEIPGSLLPRAVVFRDSFASRLIPYLSEHFSRVLYIWQKGFDPAPVEKEKPDVVIMEMVGRHLVTDTPYPGSLAPR